MLRLLKRTQCQATAIMLIRIPPKMSVASFMGYLKGRSAVIIHERHANLKYNYGNRSFGARRSYVSSVGLNQKTIEKYIRNQEAEDRLNNIMTKREYRDPFEKQKSTKATRISGW